ncbi:MAG: hypothetical protein NT002_01125 [candidate division Zixibacteria bacterium]|nr:hypothetical protein [candidate division Zixibacteria bacterium]
MIKDKGVKKLIFIASLLIISLLGLKCGSEGVVSIPRCETPTGVEDSSFTLQQPATHAARIYGPEVRPPEFRIQLYAGIPAVNWQTLRNISLESLRDVDVVIKANLQEQKGIVVVSGVILCKGGAAAQAAKHIMDAVSRWHYTPYGSGSIFYRFNIGTNRLTIDISDLTLATLPGTAKPVPVGKIHLLGGKSLLEVRFGDVKSVCNLTSIVP